MIEPADSKMSERQRAYRANYRERVAGWYNGFLHVAIIYTIGLTALYVYVSNIHAPSWLELLTIPLTFLFTNFFEWWLHLNVMHRPSSNPVGRAIYNRHTLQHHQFFTEKEMRFAGQRDYRVTFFPPYALAAASLMSIPGAIVLGNLFTANVGWLFIATTTGVFLVYEFMHFCCHVDENDFVRNMPFVNTMRRHHTAHHDQSIMMERNMNLTFPIMDWAFGTSDLNRGLIGTLLNGYDTRYVKTDMRKTSRTPAPAANSSGQGGNMHPAE